MKTIASAVIGLSLALAGFAQTAAPAPAAKTDATATPAPAKAKKVKKHSKKAVNVTAEKPVANTTPATK